MLDPIFNMPHSVTPPSSVPAESPITLYKSSQIAEQMCLFASKLFSNCAPIEYVNMIWRGSDDTRGCPNLSFFIERFNRESMWVVTEVVDQADLSKRIESLRKFIKIARECADRNNLFTAFGIMTGLNLTPVQRLKKTWAVRDGSSPLALGVLMTPLAGRVCQMRRARCTTSWKN